MEAIEGAVGAHAERVEGAAGQGGEDGGGGEDTAEALPGAPAGLGSVVEAIEGAVGAHAERVGTPVCRRPNGSRRRCLV